jgi:hypothetical protein
MANCGFDAKDGSRNLAGAALALGLLGNGRFAEQGIQNSFLAHAQRVAEEGLGRRRLEGALPAGGGGGGGFDLGLGLGLGLGQRH